jgi:glycerophosphoryl diester phosphodiesterase
VSGVSHPAAAAGSGSRSRVPAPRPLVIGHRGFPERFPDNSLAGVEAAIAAGADGVEVDVRPCADGVWVCHHDRALGGAPIIALAADKLARAGVPTLAEVAAAVPSDRFLYVEVKPLALATLARHRGALSEPLRRRGGKLRLISSATGILAALAGELPWADRSWIVDEVPASVPPGLDLSPKHTLVEKLLERGRALHPWTVNHARRMRHLARLGVASITTNRPGFALEVLGG